jgi:hypothetical protein
VSVGFDTFFGETVLKAKTNSLLEDVLVDWNAVVSYDDALGIIGLGGETPPFVFADIIDSVSFGGIHSQYFG